MLVQCDREHNLAWYCYRNSINSFSEYVFFRSYQVLWLHCISPISYSPISVFAYFVFAYSRFAYSVFAYSVFAYSVFAYSVFAYSVFAYSVFTYSVFAYSVFAYSVFAYIEFAYFVFAYRYNIFWSANQFIVDIIHILSRFRFALQIYYLFAYIHVNLLKQRFFPKISSFELNMDFEFGKFFLKLYEQHEILGKAKNRFWR